MPIYEASITREAILPGSIEAVFDFIAAEDVLPKILTGYGPLPAVVGTSENTARWDKPGASRMIHLKDGSTLREQVTHYARANYFAYRVWDFGNPIIRLLATGGRGEWTFSKAEGGTRVVWTYYFTARNMAAFVPLKAIVFVLWRGYMNICLKNSLRILNAKNNA